MTALLPSLQAERVRQSLVDYLSTTFALADAEPRRALAEFLQHPCEGIFKGPYVRLRLPYRPADDGWQEHLDWLPPIAPYRHQAEAYARLTSKDLGPDKPRALPTIITTGTGSGKTEAFLHPILDHCRRARRRRESGTKALILYPMNALADDQARRLTQLLVTDPELAQVSAGLYTGDAREGQAGQGRTKVTADGLITHRTVLREDPPDILLTNYKMLDQLLLRPEDQSLWAASATSLTYLVLDEFHTYDGAQGTDVAILLRRLGLALRSQIPADHPDREQYDARPLGKLTPVATSATLGDAADPSVMLAFASQVFGEEFPADAAITEHRVDVETFTAPFRAAVEPILHCSPAGATPVAERRLGTLLAGDIEALAGIGRRRKGDPDQLLTEVRDALYRLDGDRDLLDGTAGMPPEGTAGMPSDAVLIQAHADMRRLLDLAGHATHVDDLAADVFPSAARASALGSSGFGTSPFGTAPFGSPAESPTFESHHAMAREALATLLAALSIIRGTDRHAVTVDVTLWLRELTRLDRYVSSEPGFRWSDDGVDLGPTEQHLPALPALYCRSCGRSGWGVLLASTGRDLADRDDRIRGDHARKAGRFRALLHAPGEAAAVAAAEAEGRPHPQDVAPTLRWLHMPRRTLLLRRPAADDDDLLEGRVLPVVMLDGERQDVERASRNDQCPSCGRDDQIRFLGSAIATLLSVSLSTLFGDPDLAAREKRSLIFTDSVQDAAHRAGFVDHRSHAMSLRAALRRPLTEPMSLVEWVDAALAAAENDPFARYRLVPTALLDHPSFGPYWKAQTYRSIPRAVHRAVRRRLLFDAALEVGLQTSYGRTLESTGSLGVHVSAGFPHDLMRYGRAALTLAAPQTLDVAPATEQQVLTWVRGILERLRRDGAIDHEWLKRYVADDGNRHWIWGGRRRDQGAPAFPAGRSVPAFPVVGGRGDAAKSAFIPVASPKSWYAGWAQRCLGVTTAHGAALTTHLLAGLADGGVLSRMVTATGGTTYGLPPERITVTPPSPRQLREEELLLVCDTCRTPLPVSPTITEQLRSAPCLNGRCPGRLVATAHHGESFYRDLFATSDMRRVDAREHTSLLDGATRREIEAGFKRPEQHPGDPNVLVATPTLEMGIDIGDLSTVMLSSLPDSVAKYQQRVGRAGRLTGSSLALAYVTGRGDNLPRLGEPLSMLNGAVRPPATYLDAEEILRRQFLASVIDATIREGYPHMPRTAGDVLASADKGSLLGDVIDRIERYGGRLLDDFIGCFPDPDTAGIAALRAWVLDPGAESSATSTICAAVADHTRELEDLRRRRAAIGEAMPELQRRAELPDATEDDRGAYRAARAGRHLVAALLRDLTEDTWIAGLELRGLLPNYSLLDDSVTLDAQVSWVDPDTGEFQSVPVSIDRGSARALTELAPGADFYAHRLKMRVDGVELGQDNADVRTCATCSTCGYVAYLADPLASSPRSCPRCGGTGIGEAGQRLAVARLTRVFADLRRDDALINDDSDDRTRLSFEIVPAVDFDPARRVGQWAVAEVGLAVAHYRRLTVRWFNVGRDTSAPDTLEIAGCPVAAAQFRLCEACGKLDGGSGVNRPREHRPWCPHRQAVSEHTHTIALSRELVTQGVAISLPTAVVADRHTLPSLTAAMQLGLREVLGGAPTHLRIDVVPHPAGGADGVVHPALFLYDTVPGGTGYLSELATPARLWPILVRAARVLEGCACADEGRGCCHRCLAPFGRDVFRVDASRALRALLGLAEGRPAADADPDACEWQATDAPLAGGNYESPLEVRFRQRLGDQLARAATVTTRATARGDALTITGAGARVWHLEPQVDLDGVRPDFVLSTPGTPKIAIFTDGHTFHASRHTNRLADDARKRARLRAQGFRVLAVTYADLTSAPGGPDWLNPYVLRLLMQQPAGSPGSGISMTAAEEVERGPLALLAGIVRDPESGPRQRLADALPLLLGVAAGTVPDGSIGADDDLVALACADLRGEPLDAGSGQVLLLHRRPHLVFAARMIGTATLDIALVLDDRPEALAESDHAEAWREWLRMSNLLALAEIPATISTLQAQAGAPGTATLPGPASPALAELPDAWAHPDWEYVDPAALELARVLAGSGAPMPMVGPALDVGSTAELAWPEHHVAVVYAEMPTEEVTELRAAGWTVHRLGSETDDLAATLLADLAGGT